MSSSSSRPSLLEILQENETKELFVLQHYFSIKEENEKRQRYMGDDLYDEYYSEQQTRLLSAIERNTSITDIIISYESAENTYSIETVRQRLHLLRCQDDFARFLQLLITRLCNLRSLEVDFTTFHFSLLKIILEERKNIQELIVQCWDQVKLTDTDKMYVRSLPPQTACSSLQSVSFRNSKDYFDLTNSRKKDSACILEIISKMPRLQSLELIHWQITSLNVFTSLLSQSTTLTSLSLINVSLVVHYDNERPPACRETLDDWKALLVDALGSNSSLTRIHLQDINVSEAVLYNMITEAMTRHPSLHTVALCFTRRKSRVWSPRIKTSLVHLVQQNRGITDLTVDLGQKANENPMSLLHCYLRLNQIYKNTKAIRNDKCNCSKDWRVEALIQAHDDLGCLHCLLLEDPTVVQMGLFCKQSTDSPIYCNADFRSTIQRGRKRRRLVPYYEAISID